jgi:hypothetical protein
MSFWNSNREEVIKLSIEQIVSNAGDGSLRDDTMTSQELRTFLNVVPSDRLFAYARHCLETSFNKSGLVLQDLVNEMGRRLDFNVIDGLYQGRRNAVGFDGIWRLENEADIVIEVKTTDYVTVPLEKLADYRDKLAEEKRVLRNASMLVVVGREDTGALEAQVRGSRYAWEMRLISVEGLIKLVQIKEKSDDPNTLHQIRQLLQPLEYTKIDKIIDVIFTTAIDVENQRETEEGGASNEEENQTEYRQVKTDFDLLNAKRQRSVDSFGVFKRSEFVRYSRTLFWSPDKSLRVCCVVSKRYASDYQPYWYAYHPRWDQFLAEGKESFFILTCMDLDYAFAVPYSWLAANKRNLNVTDRGDKSYWHVALTTIEGGALAINISRIGQKLSLEPYRFEITRAKKA